MTPEQHRAAKAAATKAVPSLSQPGLGRPPAHASIKDMASSQAREQENRRPHAPIARE